MSDTTLKEYRGELTIEEIVNGMNACIRNANRLYSDAKILFDNERFPSSLALAILSIEESGKTTILRSMSIDKSKKGLKDNWISFRRHTHKNMMWIFPDLVKRGGRKITDFRHASVPSSEEAKLIDRIKQISIYVDCFQKGHWSEPQKVIEKDLASSILLTAKILTSEREVTLRELELWVEIIEPAWLNSTGLMEATKKWHNQLVEEGIIKKGSVDIDEFFDANF